jgi:polyisoprenyl-teichoic acid--peptidoglycan teichoic acid transferase
LLGDVQIDRYVRLDTEGFVQLVDALGGVEVNVPKEMHYVDKTQNLTINFLPGKQQLSGQHLQEYVRFRHDELGDIGRVQRQQEALRAILQVVLHPSTIGRLPDILAVAKQNVDSDLSVQEMLGIAQFLTHTNRQDISQVMLPGRFSRPNEYPVSYWVANTEATAPILSNYFDVKTNLVNAIADSTDNLKFLNIAVANATGEAGQAAKVVEFFRKQGFNNAYITEHEIDSSTIPSSETQIIAQQGNPNAASAIQTILGTGQVQIEATGDILSDLTVVVGTDLVKLLHN